MKLKVVPPTWSHQIRSCLLKLIRDWVRCRKNAHFLSQYKVESLTTRRQNMFQPRGRSGSKLTVVYDAEGREVEVSCGVQQKQGRSNQCNHSSRLDPITQAYYSLTLVKSWTNGRTHLSVQSSLTTVQNQEDYYSKRKTYKIGPTCIAFLLFSGSMTKEFDML